MAEIRFERMLKMNVDNLDVVDYMHNLLSYISEKYEATYESFESEKSDSDFHETFWFEKLKSDVRYHRHFKSNSIYVNGNFQDANLKADCLNYIEKNFPVYTFDDLYKRAELYLEDTPSWLIALVKGTTEDEYVYESVLEILKKGLSSTNDSTRYNSITALGLDSNYFYELYNEIASIK